MECELFIQIRPTFYTRVLIRSVMILHNLGLLNRIEVVAYIEKKAAYKVRVGNKGKWTYVKGYSEGEGL